MLLFFCTSFVIFRGTLFFLSGHVQHDAKLAFVFAWVLECFLQNELDLFFLFFTIWPDRLACFRRNKVKSYYLSKMLATYMPELPRNFDTASSPIFSAWRIAAVATPADWLFEEKGGRGCVEVGHFGTLLFMYTSLTSDACPKLNSGITLICCADFLCVLTEWNLVHKAWLCLRLFRSSWEP